MWRNTLLILIILPMHLWAEKGDFVLKGTVSIADGGSYSYELYCKDINGIVTGYSILDAKGPEETITRIIGTLDLNSETLAFKETHIESSRSKTPRSEFCFIHASLALKKLKKASGRFIGYSGDGKSICGNGTLSLACPGGELKQLIQTKETVPDSPKSADATFMPPLNPTPSIGVMEIAPGTTRTFNMDDSAITLEIWDNKDIDGDMIDVLLDGKMILADYAIQRKPLSRQVTLHHGQKNMLRIVCVDEGTEPTNTTRIKITSGKTTYTVDAVTQMKKDVLIELKY